MLEKRFQLCQRTLVKYATSFKNSIFLKPDHGRPTFFDDKSKMAIAEALSRPIHITTANYGKLLDRVAELTVSRSLTMQRCTAAIPCLSQEQLAVNFGVGKGTTPVCAIACRRN